MGALASVAFIILMARGRHPLVPLGLFRSRNFAVTNLSTFLIYGALYVIGYQQSIFSQGTLGYSAAAAGLMGLPGRSAARCAVFARWLARGPLRSAALHGGRPGSHGPGHPVADTASGEQLGLEPPARRLSQWVPSGGYLIDFLPSTLLFGLGISITVAPLTTALMASIPEARAGLGSAVNNAISRVGPQLAGALIFVAVTGVFYADLASRVPGIDTSSAQIRTEISPLNRPDPSVGPAVAQAARESSTEAFHLAMGIAAGLLLAGAAINAAGIRDPKLVESAGVRDSVEISTAPAE